MLSPLLLSKDVLYCGLFDIDLDGFEIHASKSTIHTVQQS